jgi:hypothetical protein
MFIAGMCGMYTSVEQVLFHFVLAFLASFYVKSTFLPYPRDGQLGEGGFQDGGHYLYLADGRDDPFRHFLAALRNYEDDG